MPDEYIVKSVVLGSREVLHWYQLTFLLDTEKALVQALQFVASLSSAHWASRIAAWASRKSSIFSLDLQQD